MNKESIYDAWTPKNGLWSRWVKPVLFACMEKEPSHLSSFETMRDLNWVPSIEENVCIVVDLPCEEGVILGLELAGRGYRPVPLYNAIPRPTLSSLDDESIDEAPISLVNVEPIEAALWHGTKILNQLMIKDDAPPAFLLDSNRRVGQIDAVPGSFDNRSISFPTDFPSANFLSAQKIHRVLLLQQSGLQPQADLAHTLRRWQDAGISIEVKCFDVNSPPLLCTIEKPSRFGWLWYRFLAVFGLRQNELGGFEGIISEPSSG